MLDEPSRSGIIFCKNPVSRLVPGIKISIPQELYPQRQISPSRSCGYKCGVSLLHAPSGAGELLRADVNVTAFRYQRNQQFLSSNSDQDAVGKMHFLCFPNEGTRTTSVQNPPEQVRKMDSSGFSGRSTARAISSPTGIAAMLSSGIAEP